MVCCFALKNQNKNIIVGLKMAFEYKKAGCVVWFLGIIGFR